MDKLFEKELNDSLDEWVNIDKAIAEREKKDRKIISRYCAENKRADIFGIVELLLKYDGMPQKDIDVVKTFKANYPDNLNTKLLVAFLDVKDIYRNILESGGEYDD